MSRAPHFPVPSYEPIEVRHGELHATWNIAREGGWLPHARLQALPIGPLLMLSMQAAPLLGAVSATEHQGEDFYAVLFNLQGHQRIHTAQQQHLLAPGDVFVWHSRCSGEFETTLPQDKIQILVPSAFFERFAPHLVPERGSLRIPAGSAMCTMASTCVQTLWKQREVYDPAELQNAVEAVFDLLQRTQRPIRAERPSKAALFEQVLAYIELELSDPALGPAVIARRHGCSVRALHALFAAHDTSVAGEIRLRRLEHCRHSLAHTQEDSISALALRWGFSDPAHFSKLFKATYGISPRHYRNGQGLSLPSIR
jgi:AraC family transcriptional activator of tynA and feaB